MKLPEVRGQTLASFLIKPVSGGAGTRSDYALFEGGFLRFFIFLSPFVFIFVVVIPFLGFAYRLLMFDPFSSHQVQRLCKYPLLIRELLKNTLPEDPDYVTLEDACVGVACLLA